MLIANNCYTKYSQHVRYDVFNNIFINRVDEFTCENNEASHVKGSFRRNIMSVNENALRKQDNSKITLDESHHCYNAFAGIGIFITIIALVVILYLVLHNGQFSGQFRNPVKYVVVRTPLGEIRGKEMAWDGEPNVAVNEFLAIPYAEDATNYRFLPTQKKKPWNGVLDALEYGPSCMQNVKYDIYAAVLNHEFRSENCLHLNIWAPSNTSGGLPVVIFIHGGSFVSGANSDFFYNGSAWASIGETIMVVINYRLGLFGFLDAQIEEAAGNQGIYDMSEALRWTYENIAAFGGDPNLITLMGESAGSISISMLSLYEPARRYFQRGILMSGTLFMRNGDVPALQQKLLTNIVQDACDMSYTDPLAAIKCLRNISASQLHDHLNNYAIFKLSIFPDGGHRYSMFQLPLLQLYKNASMKPVTMLIGLNQNEGRFFLAMLLESLLGIQFHKMSDLYVVQRDKFDMFVEISNNMFLQFDKTFVQKLSDRYVPPGVQNGSELIDGWSNLIGDILMKCPARYYAQFAKKFNGNVYCYENAYLPDFNFFPTWMGVTHASDLHFSFGMLRYEKNRVGARDEKMNRVMIKTFAEFARNGKMSDTNTWLAQDAGFGRCAFLDEPELGKANGSLGSQDNCDFLKEAYFTPFKSSSPKRVLRL